MMDTASFNWVDEPQRLELKAWDRVFEMIRRPNGKFSPDMLVSYLNDHAAEGELAAEEIKFRQAAYQCLGQFDLICDAFQH